MQGARPRPATPLENGDAAESPEPSGYEVAAMLQRRDTVNPAFFVQPVWSSVGPLESRKVREFRRVQNLQGVPNVSLKR